MQRIRIMIGAIVGLALGASAHGASVSASNFDQVARINALGGTVKQVGGSTPNATMLTAAGFGGTPDTASGVNVTLPGWKFVSSVTSLVDADPSQVGNLASVLTGAPTDITFTLPGAGGPDNTVGDGSFSFSQGDIFIGSFGQTITAPAGVTQDLFVFTDTDGGGSFRLDLMRNGSIVDSLGNTASTGGAVKTGMGGFLINIADGTVFDSVRIFAVGSTFEVDAVAVRCLPLPTGFGLASVGLAATAFVPTLRRRRA